MNCFHHNDIVAVGACQNCGVGLCSECVVNSAKIDSKPICKACDLARVESVILELKSHLSQIRFKKIVWSVIFAIGIFLIFMGYYEQEFQQKKDSLESGILSACCVWALAGFVKRMERREQFENSAAGVREAIETERAFKDGSIWIIWAFKIVGILIRVAFFPFFYAYLMLFEANAIKKELKECEEYKNSL